MAHLKLSSTSVYPIYRFIINGELNTDETLLFENMNQFTANESTLLVGEISNDQLMQQTLQTIKTHNLQLLSVEMI